jgi:hypothetical protein
MKTLHCPKCGEVTAVVSEDHDFESSPMPEESHCSAHHPNPEFRVENKPTVRMTVAIAEKET